jgi:branched-chain amino acid transport system substrate-binding protein
MRRIGRGNLAALVLACAVFGGINGAGAQPRYDPGATDTEIKIGNIVPYTGPASAYGVIGKTIAAYFEKINAEGGINGRKIIFVSYDDSYSPAKAVEQAKRLVEGDQVLLIFNSLGTPSNAAIRDYMNAKMVPQLFVATGASMWDDPKHSPWTMGWQPSYQTEAHIYAQYLIETASHGRIGILYQNDAFGKDYVKGLKDGLRGKIPIAAEAPYEITDTTLEPQLSKLKASGANILLDVTTPKFGAQVIRRVAEMQWKPQHIISTVSVSVGAVLKPAGLENAEGLLSANYLKEPDDPAGRDDPGHAEWVAFMDEYLPQEDKSNNLTVYGYTVAQAMVHVLEQCGDNLTRANVMRQAASLKGVRLPMLLPDIVVNTSSTDYAPLEQMLMMRFTGGRWQTFGKVRSGIDPGAVSEGFKAVFRYDSAKRETANQQNANTVTMMTGTFGSTYVQIGADLASVADEGHNFRLLPVVGPGSVQAVADILFLKGVDFGIVRTDTLDYLEKKEYANNIRKQVAYVAKLFNEEMHIIAPRTIRNLHDLDGKTVAVGLADGGTFVTAIAVFERLGITPHLLYLEPRQALEMLRRGDIDAMIDVEGKPVELISRISDENLHFVPVDYVEPLRADYLPAQLTAEDYPNLISQGEQVDTIAAASVLAAYNYAPDSDRYRRLALLVDSFFGKIKQLQQPPFHPKWKEVTLQATLPGWTRFRPAQEWLDRYALAATASDTGSRVGRSVNESRRAEAATAADGKQLRAQFQAFLGEHGRTKKAKRDPEALFQDFLEWRAHHAAR